MTRNSLAKVANYIGYGIVVAACVFVVSRITQSGVVEAIAENGGALAVTIGCGSILYACAGTLLAFAWIQLLRWCGQAPPSTRSGLTVYARTQIAKYLPGNVFHLVGRHLSGRALGLNHTPMICAAWLESLALLSAATVLSVIGLAAWGPFSTAGLIPLSALAIGLAFAAPFAMAALLPLIGRLTGQSLPTAAPSALMAGIAFPYLLYLIFFAIAGSILWLQGLGLGETDPAVLPAVVSVAAAAWILGFVTPGAAAGIGVREALLIAGLSDGLGIGNAALIALAFRGCTLIGDLLFFAAGLVAATERPAATGPVDDAGPAG